MTGQEGMLPNEVDSRYFEYTRGMGHWFTELTLQADGTFDGVYKDFGDVRYISTFHGKFSDIRKINDYTYSMRLESLDMEQEPGARWTEDEGQYVAVEPEGLTNCEEFILYTPDAPIEELPEELSGYYGWRLNVHRRCDSVNGV